MKIKKEDEEEGEGEGEGDGEGEMDEDLEDEEEEKDEDEEEEEGQDMEGEDDDNKKVYEPYKEKDYTWRVPLTKYEIFKSLETLVLSVSKSRPELKSYVLCSGI